MSSTADAGDVVEVSDEGITVTKSFTAEEFPVPAIRFEIESEHDDPVEVRLVEEIPDSFPMDSVGFHPEYHSDRWTAYQDNRVEFAGTIDPDESLITVYGIRIDDDDDAAQFLAEPVIAAVSFDGEPLDDDEATHELVEDTLIDDIVDEDRTQVVKDMLSGETDTVPGLADDADDAGGTDPSEAAEDLDFDLDDVDTDPVDVEDESDDEPDIEIDFGEESIPDADSTETDDTRSSADGTTPDTTDEESTDEESDADDADEPAITLDIDAAAEKVKADADTENVVDEAMDEADGDEAETADDGSAADERSRDEPVVDEPPEDEPDADESVASRLVAEIRAGEVDDDELAVIANELDVGPSGSELARIQHLQTRVEELAAYTDALEEFLDEHGTGAQLIEEYESSLETVESDLRSTIDRLEETESTVTSLDSTVSTVTDGVDELASEVESVTTAGREFEVRLESVQSSVETLDEEATDIRTAVDDVESTTAANVEAIESVDDDVEDLEDDVEDLEDDVEELESGVSALESEVESVKSDVTDIVEWRDQLGSMFSGD